MRRFSSYGPVDNEQHFYVSGKVYEVHYKDKDTGVTVVPLFIETGK